MNKYELIEKVSSEQGITKTEALKYVDATLKGIVATLKSGDDLTLVGFGTFVVLNRGPRKAYNPLTRKELMVPEKNYISFRAGQTVKDAINLKKALDKALSHRVVLNVSQIIRISIKYASMLNAETLFSYKKKFSTK